MNLNEQEMRELDAWINEGVDYQHIQSMIRGHAAGWIAGVAWLKRQQRKK